MIQIGYTKLVEENWVDVIETTIENTDMLEVNQEVEDVRSSFGSRSDVVRVFWQEYFGEDDEEGNRIYRKIGHIDVA
jgi:hypothetical protein